MKIIEINREPVELFKVLKFEGLASSGGEAKHLIEAGEVQVNGIVETRKRRKMVHGDVIEMPGESYVLQRTP
ncbi:RNA-binding S4 domain-containing protein [Marinihelvus fidelis]|uniref:RNA-binding S4 domain-containing protein n=1 Tax=Marinihelvus fidelis TaxID=2613842 RepID=A0A5N0TG54_9GAMM|nr:RNA-binding S4 domain-containing protein [Marinihelvus fidelis]KAA9134065.1 RNA-binding S4 domain-containing protein [Marinihelvus fidelis]